MTDHLTTARRWLSTAQDSRSFDHLMGAMDQILAHLDAQQAPQTATTTEHDPTAMDQAREHLRGLGAPCSDPAADAQAVGRFADAVAALLDQLVARADEITRQASALLSQAVQAAQEVTSAPQTAPEAEAGQGDGDEAVRAAEGYPAEAVRAVSAALHLDACTDDAHDGCDTGDWTSEAETALAAAEPHIRAKIAAEIEQHYLGADYGRNPTTGADSPDARLHEAYDEALSLAARIARGEQP